MRVWFVVAMLAACGPELPVPREPMHIDWVAEGRSGHYEKGGAVLDGYTCGERYQDAVAGVPEALDEMQTCSHYNTAYGVLMSSFVVLPLGGLATSMAFDGTTRRDIRWGGFVTGLAAFAVGFALVPFEREHRRRAVRLYNAAVR